MFVARTCSIIMDVNTDDCLLSVGDTGWGIPLTKDNPLCLHCEHHEYKIIKIIVRKHDFIQINIFKSVINHIMYLAIYNLCTLCHLLVAQIYRKRRLQWNNSGGVHLAITMIGMTRCTTRTTTPPFPSDLGLMSAFVAAVLGYERFQPQAAIVNFYHMDSTLGGHTDHSEFDLTAPLISYRYKSS